MRVDENIIAKKYARAYLNLYAQEFSKEDLQKFSALEQFFKVHQDLYVFLRITTIPKAVKEEAFRKITKAFGIDTHVEKLMKLLLTHGRIEILNKVLRQIRYCYKRQFNIETLMVTTSHPLTKSEQVKVKQFIASQSDATLMTTFNVDPSLIIGIRIESMTFLWERSIKKILTKLHHSMVTKGLA